MATVTYNLNRLQGLEGPSVFCVTLNDAGSVDPQRVIKRLTYEHPMFDARRGSAQRRHRELLNRDRSSFCGAYWGNGFHEDGVNSALAVCRALGVRASFDTSSETVAQGEEPCTAACIPG